MRGFVIPDVRPAFDACVVETVGTFPYHAIAQGMSLIARPSSLTNLAAVWIYGGK